MSVASTDNSFLAVLYGIPLTPIEVSHRRVASRCEPTVYVPSSELAQEALENRWSHTSVGYMRIIKHALQLMMALQLHTPTVLEQVDES